MLIGTKFLRSQKIKIPILKLIKNSNLQKIKKFKFENKECLYSILNRVHHSFSSFFVKKVSLITIQLIFCQIPWNEVSDSSNQPAPSLHSYS